MNVAHARLEKVNTEELIPMLTVKEVAKLLHINTNTVRLWSDKGIITAYRISHRGDRRFKASDIANVVNQLNQKHMVLSDRA